MPKGRPGTFYEHTEESLREKCVPEPNSGCLLWLGPVNWGGYGHVLHGGKRMGVHRAMHVVAIGPIPKGMDVCHKCDVRSCINPAHLFVGTRKENLADMDRKGRRVPPRGERSPRTTLTADAVRSILSDIRRGDRLKDIGPRYGVTPATVSLIKNGKNWKHIREEA